MAVVGGGPAGVVFALTAAERGHEVTLYEALVKCNAAPEIYNTGDSFSGGRVLEAVRGAYALAERI